MKKSMLTTTIIVMMSSSAFAIVGSSTTRSMGGPAAVCRMLNRNPDQTLKGICSATLVAPNKVLTAGHCIPKAGQTLTVECGFLGYTQSELSLEKTASGSQVYTKGVHFKESAIALPFFKDLSRDTAILILDKNLTATPIKILPEIKFEDTAHCLMAGYGRTNDTTGGILYRGVQGRRGYFPGGLATYSVLKAIGVTQADVDEEGGKKISEKSFITDDMVDVMGRPGDSGSPLLCKLENGETVIAGVFSFVQSLLGLPSSEEIKLNITPFYQIGAYYKTRPTMLKAVEQDVAPQEDAEEPVDEQGITFPN